MLELRCQARTVLAALCVAVLAASARAGYHEELVSRLNIQQKRALEKLVALSPQSLDEIARNTTEDRIRAKTEEILSRTDSLAIGSRAVDPDGCAAIHRYLLEQAHTNGLEYVGSLKDRIAVPVSLDRRLDAEQRGPRASVTVGDATWPVTPMWPNGPLPSLCPEGGLEGPLVYAGRGDWQDVEGLDLARSIVLMDFAGGRNWDRLFMLGAQAVIVIADDHVNQENASHLFANTPIPFPRFFADEATGARLRAIAVRQPGLAGPDAAATARCRLVGGNIFENRPIESLFFYLPPTEPIRYDVTERDLLERIALDYGVSASDLLTENGLTSPRLAAGQELAIPGQAARYVVKPNDLAYRLLREFGLQTNSFMEVNGLSDLSLQPGSTVTIPNINDTLVICAKIDSVSVAPDAPHGAHVAANLAATLVIMEHLADSRHIQRRKGVLFAFLDGDNYGGRASRGFAEHLLLGRGELKSAVSQTAEAGSGFFRFFAILVCTVILTIVGFFVSRVLKKMLADRGRWLPVTVLAAAAVAGVLTGRFVPVGWLEPKQAAGQSTEEARIAMYRNALAWLASPATTELTQDAAEWLTDDWIAAKFEKKRIQLAEDRIKFVNAESRTTNRLERAAHRTKIRAYDKQIELLVDIRQTTYENKRLSRRERLDAFLGRLTDPATAVAVGEYELALPLLQTRMQAEYDEEIQDLALASNNIQVAEAVVAALHPDRRDPDKRARHRVIAWFMDISDGSHTLTMQGAGDARSMGITGANAAKKLEPRQFNTDAYAAITAGWPEQWTYFGPRPHPDFSTTGGGGQPPRYAEFLALGQMLMIPITTQNDRQQYLDTPGDIPANRNFRNLGIQTRTALVLLKTSLESHADSESDGEEKGQKEFGRLVGATVQFNIRSGIDAKDPVPHAYVYYPAIGNTVSEGNGYPHNTAMAHGGRFGIVVITKLNGSYALPLESYDFFKARTQKKVYAYRLDPKTGLFDMVLEQAAIGTKKEKPTFKLLAGRDSEKRLILTRVYPLIMFADVDPRDYAGVPNPREHGKDQEAIEIVDAMLNGSPRHFARDNPALEYNESGLSATIVYVPQERRVRILIEERTTTKVLLIGPFADADDDKGLGYAVGPTADGDRNLALHVTPLRIAADFHQAAERRRKLYFDYGIRDQSLEKAVKRSGEKLAEAETFAEKRQWQKAVGASRECWGILIKNYPTVMRLGREAVFSVVFLMALLVPAAVFLERLMMGSKSVAAQLIGTTIIFSVGTIFLRLFHPAFKIAVSPFIVVIAFTMILMSVIVLSICYQRFEVLLRRARIAGGEVESEEISLASSLATAFSLGVSNLKKRPVRTALTTFTVSVLTFSIITFVSVKGRDTMVRRNVALDTDVEGQTIEPETPRYEGILFRGVSWGNEPDGKVSSLRTEFGNDHVMAARAAYVQSTGGNNADREGVNQIELGFGRKNSIVNAVMCFEPAETELSQLNKAVSREQWFEERDLDRGVLGHRFHIIIPDNAARDLGITEAMLYDANGKLLPDQRLPQVSMLNNQWRVIGIMNTAKADRMRDITGKGLGLVDYLRSGITPNATGFIENEPQIYHMSWTRLVCISTAARQDISKCYWKSIAIKFNENENVDQFLDDLALRRQGGMFSHINGELALMTTKIERSIGGLAKILVPIILCVLIVANTMMGAVDERKGEVEMLGAVGLSPSQISFLLMSEATVFSVLGIIFGVFSGLAFSKIVLHYPSILSGLSFNFTSLASTWLAMSTGLIVLIATLVPAKRAAAMATPSGMEKWELPEPTEEGEIDFHLPFTLTRGNAVGMLAFIRRFMLNHTEATSQDFNCRNVVAALETEPQDALSLTAVMWLAPYDLDVAQNTEMRVSPTETEGVFRAAIRLHRLSGTEESWLRTNYAFMDLVRHQFLLWRNLETDLRKTYIQEGAALLQGLGTDDG